MRPLASRAALASFEPPREAFLRPLCLFFWRAGVASHGHRAVIVGGVGNLQEGRHQLLLADVFEFDARIACWVQVGAPYQLPRMLLSTVSMGSAFDSSMRRQGPAGGTLRV